MVPQGGGKSSGNSVGRRQEGRSPLRGNWPEYGLGPCIQPVAYKNPFEGLQKNSPAFQKRASSEKSGQSSRACGSAAGCPLGLKSLIYGMHGTQPHGGRGAGRPRKDSAALLLDSRSLIGTGRNSCLGYQDGRRGKREHSEFPRTRLMRSAGDFRPRCRPRPHLSGLTPGVGGGVSRRPSGAPARHPRGLPLPLQEGPSRDVGLLLLPSPGFVPVTRARGRPPPSSVTGPE